MGKLTGIKVVDLSLFLPGPMLTLMMADQGAQVVKVEPPTGDPSRTMEPMEGDGSVWFNNLNRAKQCVRLDLKADDGRAELWRLVEEADVLVEGFRPGVMDRLGFGYEAVSQRNPAIVYCSVSAFGQSGPMAHHPAHDIAVQAHTGFLSVNDNAEGTPVVPGVPSADMAAGLTGLAAVLMALIGRQNTGKGEYLDIAMFDSLLPWCAHIAGSAIAGDESPVSRSQRSLGGAAFYQVYRTADDRHVVLGGREMKFATNLLTALGRPDLIAHAERPAGEQEELTAFLAEQFATRTRAEWEAWFADKDVAFAPVLDFREALDQPFIQERGLIAKTGKRHMLAPAIRMSDTTDWRSSAESPP